MTFHEMHIISLTLLTMITLIFIQKLKARFQKSQKMLTICFGGYTKYDEDGNNVAADVYDDFDVC